MMRVLGLLAGWLVLVNGFALVVNNRVNLEADTAFPWIVLEYTFQVQSWNPGDLRSRWDSHFYRQIAEEGYAYAGEGELSNLAFFPLYPILIRVFAWFGMPTWFAGWWVNTLALAGTVLLLYRLVEHHHKESKPLSAVWLMLLFPTAFFLQIVYSEALYLFLSVATFYFLLNKRYRLSGVMGMLAALTRFTGVVLVVPVMVELWWELRQKRWRWDFLSAGLIPLGTVLYFGFHWLRFGNFLLFFEVQQAWGRGFSLNLEHLQAGTYPAWSNLILDSIFLVAGLAGAVWAWRKLRVSYGLYMLVMILVPVSSGTLMSIGRYVLVLFPLYILGAGVTHEVWRYVWVTASTLFLGLYTLLLAAHYWAG